MKQGWEKRELAKACKLFTDGDWIESKDQSIEGIRLIQTGNIGFGEYLDKKEKAKFISEETFKRLKCTEVLTGDILVSRLPEPVGRSCIVLDIKSKMITAVDCTIIRTKENLLPEFLRYFQLSNSYLKNVESRTTGTTRNRISRKNLGLIEIPTPPPLEQKRIVAKLDQCFKVIDQAKANVECNLQNAKELFQSQLNQIFSQKGDEWVEKKLGDVCQVIAGQSPKGKYYNSDEKGLPFYQGKKEFADKYISAPKTWTTMATKEAFEGDILMSVRAPVGPINFSTQHICIGRGLAAIRAGETVNKEYLFYYLLKHENEIVGNTGAVFNSINKTQIGNIVIPMVSLSEQEKIVKQLDDINNQTQSLKSHYQQELDTLDELKKSILQKAFNGELTTKEIEATL